MTKRAAAPGQAATAEFKPVPLPKSRTLSALKRAASTCRACPLWRDATQTVFGAGPRGARVVLIGEQPGDHEDRKGRPFVGPAGRLLDRALEAAQIDRGSVYLTNAVKHFKWEPRGPRRLHKKPGAREIGACRPWLMAEIEAIAPELLVCLGATAVQAVFGERIRVTRERGVVRETPLGPPALLTVHPSSLLRIREREEADREFSRYVSDLEVIAAASAGGKKAGVAAQ